MLKDPYVSIGLRRGRIIKVKEEGQDYYGSGGGAGLLRWRGRGRFIIKMLTCSCTVMSLLI